MKPKPSGEAVAPSMPFVILSAPAVNGEPVTVAWSLAEVVLPPTSLTVTVTVKVPAWL